MTDTFNPNYNPSTPGCSRCQADYCECEAHRRAKAAGLTPPYLRKIDELIDKVLAGRTDMEAKPGTLIAPMLVAAMTHGPLNPSTAVLADEPDEFRTMANGADSGATKPSNPKEAIGDRKLPLELVPASALVGMSFAFLEGALKYGRFNWRVAGVRASTYKSAVGRHLEKWWNGENEDPESQIHHLDNAMACLAIMRDAMLAGKFNDDRPPRNPGLIREINDAPKLVAHLKELFKDHAPKQWTIADSE